MRTIKIISLSLILLISGSKLFSQNIDEGKKFIYNERYNSAKGVFTKLVNANANNIEAVYWLGQSYINMDDTTLAESLYQKTLMANSNSPLLLAGIGHVELLRGKTNDARNRFETAISLSKGKDANVLAAIGRANVNAKDGDAAYAIEKLNMASKLNPKNVEILLLLGDAYRKIVDGSNAQLTYQAALALDPNNARAYYMMGRIFQTQGITQEPIYMNYYNQAIAKDPNFAPVYAWLSEYYYHRDINKSRDYLDKYIAVADADSKNCYYQASFLYASSKFQEAINKANQCISAGENPYPKLYGVQGYAAEKLGDSLNAKKYFETLFAKLPADQLGPTDYATYARVLLKFPGNEALAASYIDKALALDTVEADKVEHITSIANNYLTQKNYNEAAKWYTKLLSVKKDPGKVDIYNAGYNYYKGASYTTADSIFKLYSQKYPDELLGYYMSALSEAYIDSTGALGLAKADYDKVIQLGEASTDTAKVKSQLINAYRYMVAYYYTNKNDKATALTYIEKILKLDPTDASALKNREALTAPSKFKQKGDVTKTKTETSKQKVTTAKKKVKKK